MLSLCSQLKNNRYTFIYVRTSNKPYTVNVVFIFKLEKCIKYNK